MFTLDDDDEEERELAVSTPQHVVDVIQELSNRGHRFPWIIAQCAECFRRNSAELSAYQTECVRALLRCTERDMLREYMDNGVED